MNKQPHKKKLVIGIGGVVIFAVAAAFLLLGKNAKSIYSDLEQLRSETKEINEDFTRQYSTSEMTSASIAESWSDNVDKDDFTPLYEVKAVLQELPDDFAGITKRNDIFAITYGNARQGHALWETFLADTRLGRNAQIIVAQFTVDEDPIYFFLEYNGDSYHVVEDITRDGYDEEFGYVEAFGKYFKVEDYLEEDAYISEYAYLTDDRTLSYKKVQEYYGGNAGKNQREPSCWEFFIRNITEEEITGRLMVYDDTDMSAAKEYTGFADVHPYFAEENPCKDYDGDGILDRIYRECIKNGKANKVNIYCFLGNGTTITLQENMWGEKFLTDSADFTNDAVKDICFIQYTSNGNISVSGATIFEWTRNGYEKMLFPMDEFQKNISHQSGGNVLEYKAAEIQLLPDKNGQSSLQCTTGINTDEDNNSTKWVLYYQNQEWKIRDISKT